MEIIHLTLQNLSTMLMKVVLFILCFQLTRTLTQNQSLVITKIPLRDTKVSCKSDKCISKCCPLGMVYYRKFKRGGCINGDQNVFEEQNIYVKNYVSRRRVNLTEYFEVLIGAPCVKKHRETNPLFLQEVI